MNILISQDIIILIIIITGENQVKLNIKKLW